MINNRTLTYQTALVFLAILFCLEHIKGQEVINFVGYPALKLQSSKQKSTKGSLADTLELPFFDDFSDYTFYPDDDKWADNYAFINNSYAKDPPSLGVATLDAISNKGEFYPSAGYGNFFSADTLSSLPLNLDYPGDNSIFLSFYYQPQGLGDNPEQGDSLLLEFYAPDDEVWEKVKGFAGDTSKPFEQFIININQDKYLKKGFRFRFRNIASLISDNEPSKVINADHWHIDYVKLDRGRDILDTDPHDIAFVYPMSSFLKNYEAMPWQHFLVNTAAELGTSAKAIYKNNDAKPSGRNIERVYFVFDDNNSSGPNDTLFGGSYDMLPGEQQVLDFYSTYPFLSSTTDSASFTVKCEFVTDTEDPKVNNEVSYVQRFYDYYAYDDGTAEASYGLTGDGAKNARLAYKFDCKKQDTLKAIQMYFSRTLNDATSNKYFYLTFWDDNNGMPGSVIYKQEAVKPEFENELNKFHTYYIDTTLVFDGVFYVGWIQTTSDMLNIGLDFNRVRNDNIFYNIGGIWENSSFEAALMIRPFFGKRLTLSEAPIPPRVIPEVTVYPNPTKDYLTINITNTTDYKQVEVQIFNLSGRLVHQSVYHSNAPIKLSSFREGLYLLRLIDRKKGLNYTQKIIKIK